MKNDVSKMTALAKQVYYSKHVGPSEYTNSLKEIPQLNGRTIVTPGTTQNERTGDMEPDSDLPAEPYKLQSVLFNRSIVIKKGVVTKIREKDIDRLQALEDMFRFLKRFENRNMTEFLDVFNHAIRGYIQNNKTNACDETFNALDDIHEFSRLLLALRDEPERIVNDLESITNADQFGVTTDPAQAKVTVKQKAA